MDLTEFLAARLDEEEPAEVCGCLDANHWPPCVPQPWKERERREITAKRAVLAAHGPDPIGKFGSVEEPRCLVCLTGRDGYEEQWEADDWPCLTLRNLAAVYSDHPDYRDEWKP